MQKILENLEKQESVQSERAFMMMWRYYVLLEWISVIQRERPGGYYLAGESAGEEQPSEEPGLTGS